MAKQIVVGKQRWRAAKVASGNGLLNNLVEYWAMAEASGNLLGKYRGLTLIASGNPLNDTGIVYPTARKFLDSQYAYRVSEPLLQAGTGSLSFATWVYWSGDNNHGWLGKRNVGTNGEYWGTFYSATGQSYPYWQFRNAADTAAIGAKATVVVQPNTWTFIVGWYDHPAGTANIQINNGDVYTTNCGSVGIRNASEDFKLGTYYDAGSTIRGRMGPFALWKGEALSKEKRDALYNAGSGLTFEKFDYMGAEPFWLTGGIHPTSAKGIYRARGAVSLAASYVNLANPGTSDLTVGVLPAWDTVNGWGFDGLTKFLKTGIAPGANWSVVCKYTDHTGGYAVFGCDNGSLGFKHYPSQNGSRVYANGSTANITGPISAGIVALSGANAYLNGSIDYTNLTNNPPAFPVYIGANNRNNTSTIWHCACNVQYLFLYDVPITQAQLNGIIAKEAAL